MSGRSAVTGAAFFTQMGRDENSSNAAKPSWSKHWKQWAYYLGVLRCTYTNGQEHHGKNEEKAEKWFQVRYMCDVKNWRL